MKLITLIFILGLTFGCQQSTNETIKTSEKEEQTSPEKVKVTPNKMLLMEVDGMSCVMGCGSSIRKELYATNGVSEVEFDFEEGRETQKAFIKFNSNIVSVDEMIQIVKTMNENQFTVGNVSEENLNNEKTSDETIEEAPTKHSSILEENSRFKTSLPKIKLPNFIEIITSFLSSKTFKFIFN